MASASRPNSGNAYSGPVWTGGSVNTDALSSDGTCTPASSMSWLPVARSPTTCHVSWIVNVCAGASTSRTSGIPLGSVRTVPPSSTTQPPISQSACRQPLANGQRPLTR